MFRLKTFIIFLFILPQITVAQKSELLKYWAMIKTTDCSDHRLPETNWDVEFKSNGTAELGVAGSYSIITKPFTRNDSILDLEYQKLTIHKITKDSLILKSRENKCRKYVFLTKQGKALYKKSQQDFLIKQNNTFFMNKGDTIYIANRYNAPKMKNYSNKLTYFIKALSSVKNDYKACQFQFEFIVLKDGSLSDSRGSTSCIKKSDRKINQIIKNMKNEWKPMLIDGNPVNALVKIRLKYD